MKKLLKVLIIVAIVINSLFVNAMAAVGTEQKLKTYYSENEIDYYLAVEDDEPFYVYCFNSDLHWPERPESTPGKTITYVPDDFLHLSDDVKNKIHRIFYAGYPHNNAGLYIVDEEGHIPTITEISEGLVFDSEILTDFPELQNHIFTYFEDGTGTLNNFDTPEAQIMLNIESNIMEWSYTEDSAGLEKIKRTIEHNPKFFAFLYAYSTCYFAEDQSLMGYFYKESLGPIGMEVSEDDAHAATQYAIWIVLNKEGVPYNSKQYLEKLFDGSLVKRLVDFAYGSDPIPSRNYNQTELTNYINDFNNKKYLLNSSGVDINTAGGGIKFFYNPSDKKYYSEKLKFLTSSLMDHAYISKFDIEVLNNNDVLYKTIQYGKNEFVLVSDTMPTGTKVSVKSNNYWPSPIYQYRAKDDVTNNKHEYQEMSGVKYETVQLQFEAAALNENTDLTIKKIVDNKDAAKDTTFWFNANIVIKDVYGNQVDGELAYTKYKLDTSGNILTDTSKTGKVYNYGYTTEGYNTKFSLQADEAIVFHNLPYGTTYSVVEYGLSETGTSTGNWTPAYTGNSGTVSETGTNTVVVSNTYAFTPISLNINGTKTLKQRSDDTTDVPFGVNDFSFILWPDVHGNPMPSDSEYNNETLRYQKIVKNTAPTSGVATFDFGTISFNKAGDYSYTIEEQQVKKENITKDPNHYHVNVHINEVGGNLQKTVTVENHKFNHDPIGTAITVADGQPASVAFKNTYSNAYIDKEIRIKKTILNTTESNENIPRNGYVFEIKPYDTNVSKYPDFVGTTSKECQVTTGASGEAVSPLLEFTDSWFATNDTDGDKKIDLKYKITEIPGAIAGITYSNEEAYANVVIEKTFENNNSSKPLYTAKILYDYGSHTDSDTPAVFTNTYKATGNLTININKSITSLISYTPVSNETYKVSINDNFERNGDKTGYTLPTNNTINLVYNSGNFVPNGNVITFNKAGDYRFELSEVNENAKGVTYDSNKWIVDVNVVDNKNGTLTATPLYFKESSSPTPQSSITFENKYTSTVSIDLNISKELIGRPLNDSDSFSFKLYHSEGSITNPCDPHGATTNHINITHPTLEVLDKSNNFNLKVENAINIHKAGKYYVSVAEIKPEFTNLEYDTSVYIMEIDVEQEGNSLKIKNGYPKYYKAPNENGWDLKEESTDKFIFKNKTTNLSITKKVEQLSSASKYRFEITLKNKLNQPLVNANYNATLNGENYHLATDENGKANFTLMDGDILNVLDLPNETKYTIKEETSSLYTTNFITKENGVEKPLIDGNVMSETLESGVNELVIVRNKGITKSNNKHSYRAPDTCAR